MGPIDPDATVRLRLYARAELPPPAARRAEAICERARSLVAEGVVDACESERWPKRVPLDDCEDDLRDVYLSFAGWAADAGVGLQPFFQTRVCYGPETGERADWLVLPALALAVEADGDLLAVYPHERDGETATVEDGLDCLEAALAAEQSPGVDEAALIG